MFNEAVKRIFDIGQIDRKRPAVQRTNRKILLKELITKTMSGTSRVVGALSLLHLIAGLTVPPTN
jgi:hypothetical protein